jgi:hypothetical protein
MPMMALSPQEAPTIRVKPELSPTKLVALTALETFSAEAQAYVLCCGPRWTLLRCGPLPPNSITRSA